MMPIMYEWDMEPEWLMLQDEWSPAPSENIWKKFDCLAPDLSPTLDQLWELETEAGFTSWTTSKREIRHHDCMWAGHCLSKEHRATRTTTDVVVSPTVSRNQDTSSNSTVVNTNTASTTISTNPIINNSEKECVKSAAASGGQQPVKRTAVIVQRTVGRSLLLNRTNQQQQQTPQQTQQKIPQTPPERPETPQSLSESEDETSGRQEDDAYWESARGVAATEVTGQVRRGHAQPQTSSRQQQPQPVSGTATSGNNSNVQFDHNYDAKANVRLDDLGVQTPSDSDEEEIDVVSVRGVGTALPTNPSRAMRAELQVAVASMTAGKLLSAASEAVSRRLRRPKRNKEEDDDLEAGDEEYLPRKRPRSKHHHHHHHYHRIQQEQTQSAPVRSPRKPANRFSTDSETDTTEKRSLHNNMERMRRIDLRNLFEDLRSVVPCLSESSRAAKVTILKEAANYCYELTGIGKSLHSQVAALRKEQEKLRANLSRLRRNLAARR